MDSFTLKETISFDYDKDSLKRVEEQASKIGESMKLDKETLDKLKDEFKLSEQISQLKQVLKRFEGVEGEATESLVNQINEQIEKLEQLRSPKKEEDEKESSWISDSLSGLKDSLITELKSLGTKFLNSLKNIFIGGIDELKKMVDYSKLTNSSIRDLKFTYGFSSAEAYAFDKAKEIQGIQSDEDLYYMDEGQRERFREDIIKYTEKYNQLYDSGTFEKIQEYSFEMKEFEEDLKLKVVEWIMNHKDVIRKGMDAIMKLTDFTLSALSSIARTLGAEKSQDEVLANTESIISNYTNSKNITFNNVNTYNGANDSGKSLFEKSFTSNIKQVEQAIKQM